MTATLFWRLVWKEYRVQRALWFSLLTAVVALQGLIFLLSYQPDRAELWFMLVSISGFLGWFYALGSGAIGFASEREEDTQIRLVTMACPAGASIAAKLSFGTVTTLLFFACGVLSATLIAPPNLSDAVRRQAESQALPIVTVFVGGQLLALLFGMVCSLQCQKVLTALITAGASCVIFEIFLLALAVGDPTNSPTHSFNVFLTFAGSVACVLLLAVTLMARNWLNRDFVSSPMQTGWRWLPRIRFVQVSSDGTILIPIGDPAEERFSVPSLQQALATRAPSRIRWWSAWLFGNLGRHEWRFLAWREWVETRKMFWCSLFVLWLLSLTNLGNYRDGPTPPGSWSGSPWVAVSSLAALACGFLTFRQEQQGKRFLFLTQRGVAPTTVWATKQFAWSLRLLLALFVLNALPMLFDGHHWREDFLCETEIISDGGMLLPPGLRMRTLASAATVPCLLTLYFVIGQFASLFAARTVTSFFIACFLGSVATAWVSIVGRFGVPVWMTGLPISAALFAATWLRTREWMMERTTGRTALRIGGVSAFGLGACILLIGQHRATEIPDVTVTQATHAATTKGGALYGSWSEPSLNRASHDEQLRVFLAPVSDIERQTAETYLWQFEALEQFLKDSKSKQLLREEEHVTDRKALEAELAALRPIIATLHAAAVKKQCAFGAPDQLHCEDQLARDVSGKVQFSLQRFDGLAKSCIVADQHQMALDLYLLGLRVAVDVQRRGNVWISNPESLPQLLAGLREWSAHASVTSEMRTQAIAGLTDFLREVPTPQAFALAEHAFNQRLLQRPDFGEWLQERYAAISNGQPQAAQNVALNFAIKLPGETERLRRLLNIEHAAAAQWNADFAADCAAAFARGARLTSAIYADSRHQFGLLAHLNRDRMFASTPLLQAFPNSDLVTATRRYLELEIDVRATALMIGIIDEHRGRATPATLELKHNVGMQLLDPCSGAAFDWWPDGLPRNVAQPPLAPPGRPFLMSRYGTSSLLTLRRIRYVKGEGPAMGSAPGMPGIPQAPTEPLVDFQNEPPIPAVKEPELSTADMLKASYAVEFIPEAAPFRVAGPKLFVFPAGVFSEPHSREKPAWLDRVDRHRVLEQYESEAEIEQ